MMQVIQPNQNVVPKHRIAKQKQWINEFSQHRKSILKLVISLVHVLLVFLKTPYFDMSAVTAIY